MDLQYRLESLKSQQEWFVLTPMGFSGPYTTAEVTAFLSNNQIGGHNSVWHEGFSNWQRICETEQFNKYFDLMPALKNEKLDFNEVDKVTSFDHDNSPLDKPSSNITREVERTRSHKQWTQKISRLKVGVGIFICGLSLFAFYELLSYLQSYKGFAILSPEQNAFLKSVASDTHRHAQPQAAFVFAKRFFFVSCNLSNGNILELNLTPMLHTFFIEPKKIATQKLRLNNRTAIGNYPLTMDGEAIAPGYYTVALTYHDEILYKKEIFLGELSFDEYRVEFEKFNIQKISSARTEISELSQIVDSLQQQANALYTHFTNLQMPARTTRPDLQSIKKWKASTDLWLTYQSQIGTIIENWNLQNDSSRHYVELYKSTESIEKRLSKLKFAINNMLTDSNSAELKRIEKEFLDLITDISRQKSRVDFLQSNPTN